MAKEEVEQIKLDELWRIYIFPNGQEVKFDEPLVCFIGGDGTHQLRNNKGEILIVPPRWLAFKIQQKEIIVNAEKKEEVKGAEPNDLVNQLNNQKTETQDDKIIDFKK
jgi:hypothetical protein